MKKLILLLLLLPCFAMAQKVYFPKLKVDSLTHAIDTLGTGKTKTPMYDVYNLRLEKWENGYWYATAEIMPGYVSSKIYVKDDQFVKTYEYRTALEVHSKKAKAENQKSLQSLIKKYGKRFGTAIYYETVEIGMTAQMVRLALGAPKKVNTTRTVSTVREQWIYYSVFGKEQTDSKYYYITNGKLTGIQD